MKIQIDGTNTKNKGAELMLVTILDELKERYPKAEILINENSDIDANLLVDYNLNLKIRGVYSRYRKLPMVAILRRLRLPYDYFTSYYVSKKVDLVIDASGFQYGDQWKISDLGLEIRERYYKKLSEIGTKIVLLPQAFGPFETANAKKSIAILNKYVDILIAREKVSYEYLKLENVVANKLFKYTDFTLKTKGIVPEQYKYLKEHICIIPNKKMITHGDNKGNSYRDFILTCIKYLKEKEEKVFLLNHEGEGDLQLCKEINALLGDKNQVDIVSGLKAKEIKGVIGLSKLVISSRFHGVASALSQAVPCLATSWNHKYEMLFDDFNQKDNVFDFNSDWGKNKIKLDDILSQLHEIRDILSVSKLSLLAEIEEMWDRVFSINVRDEH